MVRLNRNMVRPLIINCIHPIDCIQGMKQMKSKSVDVVVTSPPLNIGIKYGLYKDNKSRDEYLAWMGKVANALKRVMKDDASLFLNMGGKLSDPWIPIDVALIFRESGFILQNMIHWINSIAIQKSDVGNYPNIKGDIAIGHYKPVNSQRVHHDGHEFIFHFTLSGKIILDKKAIGIPYQDKSNIGRWKSSITDCRDRGNTWFIPYKTINVKRKHPSIFPIQLPEMCLKDHGLSKIDLVLDPFMGIGSTALACTKLNINYVGFEIDQTYIDIANERLKKMKEKNE